MNLSDLKNLTWSWLDDPNHTYFTSSQVTTWLNNGLKECQKQLIQAGENFYVTRASTQTIANYDTYALPSDFLKLNKLELLLSGTTPNEVRQTLRFSTLVEIDNVSMTTGTPAAYTLKKNCLLLRPIPDIVYTLYMDYSYLVADMTSDGSIPDVPIQYHEYIAILATIDGLLKDQRDASTFLAKKDFYLSLMKQDAEQRRVDSSREVISTDADFGYLW